MTPVQLLKAFARPEMMGRYPWMALPWVHAGYAYASDTRMMVRLPSPGEPDTPHIGPKFLASLPGMYPGAEPTPFDADDLREWLGPATRGPICYHCGIFPPLPDPRPESDSPFWEDDREPIAVGPGCDSCHDGYARPDGDPVNVFGATFDGWYLRQALNAPFVQGVLSGTFGTHPPLPVNTHVAGPVQFAPRPTSFTVGDARFLLMPMETNTLRPTYVPGIGALWHLRNTNRRCALIDWCLEHGVELTDIEGVPF